MNNNFISELINQFKMHGREPFAIAVPPYDFTRLVLENIKYGDAAKMIHQPSEFELLGVRISCGYQPDVISIQFKEPKD